VKKLNVIVLICLPAILDPQSSFRAHDNPIFHISPGWSTSPVAMARWEEKSQFEKGNQFSYGCSEGHEGLQLQLFNSDCFSLAELLPLVRSKSERPLVDTKSSAIRRGTCYAATGGHEASDGSTWSTAKDSLMSCYDSLSEDGGTIFFTDDGMYSGSQLRACAKNDPPGCGIWIMGKKDPNFAHPPRGWRRAKRTISFIGVGGTSFGANTRFGGKPGVLAGSGVDRNHPSIWLSAVSGAIFRNMATFATSGVQPLRGIVIGETSDNDRTGIGSCATILLDNVDPSLYGDPNSGPGIAITGGSFWITIQNSLVTGAYGQTLNSDNRAAILIDGSDNDGNGLVVVADTNVNGGGIKYVPGRNPGSLTVRDLTIEGDFTHDIPPAVWISGSGTANGTTVTVENITVADPGPIGAPALRVDGGVADNCSAAGVSGSGHSNNGVNVQGPCMVLSQFQSLNLAASNDQISPLRWGQSGTFLGHLVGQTDSARRGFSPSSVRFMNLASQEASSWSLSQYGGKSHLKNGTAAPDGTANAAVATSEGSRIQENLWFTGGNGHLAQKVSIGDWYVMGAWIRSVTANGYSQSNTQALGFDLDDVPADSVAGTHSKAPNRGDGEWEWQWIAEKVIHITRSDTFLQFCAHFDRDHAIEVYAPALVHIPANTISDNEAYELAISLQSFPDTALPGDVSTLRNERLSIGGSTHFFAKLTHSCTTDCIQKFPDSSGPNDLAATNLEQGWAKRQKFQAGSVFGDGTTLSRYGRYTARLSPASVPPNSCASQAFDVEGLRAGDVLVGVNKPSEQEGLNISPGHVPNDNSVTINFCNVTGSPITPTAQENYNFAVVQ
jgi:hypothetical protein